MNCIIISPNFPDNFRFFSERLNSIGVTVLGIGDAPFDDLSDTLKSSLTEYYKVSTLEDYDQVYRAVAFFAHKYGKPDWLESNNEYWLRQDARLREEFNITSGVMPDQLASWQSKSAMKPVYKAAGIPCAREHVVTDLQAALAFIESIGGYPVFAKPDTGVGSSHTYRIENDEDLAFFFEDKPEGKYLMEEFIEGDICTYDAICNSAGEPLFESSYVCSSVADTVNGNQEMMYFVLPDVPDQLREYGRKALKGFNVSCRFVHFEFFRLKQARKGLGKVGDYVALESNFRPAGGYSADMMNYAHSTDVYKIWADMVTSDTRTLPQNGPERYCIFAGKKDFNVHHHDDSQILERYGDAVKLHGRMPDVLADAMGNQMYIAVFDTYEEVIEFGDYVMEEFVPEFLKY